MAAVEKIVFPSILDGLAVSSRQFEIEPSKTVFQEFSRQIGKCSPAKLDDTSAIIDYSDGSRLSYSGLYALVKRLIAWLRFRLVGSPVTDNSCRPVAVFLPPSSARIATLLALNALGLPYVPLDHVQTKEQRSFILEHSKAQAIIRKACDSDFFPINGITHLNIEDGCDFNIVENGVSMEDPKSGDDEKLSLILYTSGSTGIPKGICLTDANLLNRLRWQWAELPFATDDSDVCLAKTNHLFVDSYTEILGAVLRLQRIVVVNPNEWRKTESANVAALMTDTIAEHKVTRLILVPSLLSAMLEVPNAAVRLASLRFVVSSGEALPCDLARRFFQTLAASTASSQARLANFYGSTEVTGDVTAVVFASEADVLAKSFDGFVSLGRPIYNTTIYVCHEDLVLPVPFGEIGHIFVSGENVCKGFAGEAKNAIDRFSAKSPGYGKIGNGNRFLSMGDLGRIVPGGELVYCGRSDSLVKIRGHRVSTVQVEDALKAIIAFIFEKAPAPRVPRCRVVAFEHQQSATFRLAAFYETWQEAVFCLRPDNIRKSLSDRLPHYAVPELLLPLEMGTFPLQPHTGKTDQRALKKMAADILTQSEQGVEQLLANFKIDLNDILKSARDGVCLTAASTLGLSLDHVIMDATFFNQGGNSLSVIAAVLVLNKIGFKNANAELLFCPEKTLEAVAKDLSESFSAVHQELEASSSVEAAHSWQNRTIPAWINFRNLTDLNDKETHFVQKRMAYSFAVLGPIAGKLLNLPSDAYYKPLVGEWKLFSQAGDLSFVAIDNRISGDESIVGAVLCTDLTVKNPDHSIWDGLEAISAFSHATEAPVHDELRRQYSSADGTLPPGVVLSYRMLYVESNIDDNDASAVFLELEVEVIRRARAAGYKSIVTKNASSATQTLERDLLGYKERHGVFAAQLVLPDGSRPYSHAPPDYSMVTMTLDL